MEVREQELLSYLGCPNSNMKNSIGLVELDFGSKVFRFDPSGALSEVTIESEVVELDHTSIPFEDLAARLKAEDAGVFEKYGFIVSPEFGLAFDPEHSPWVTVLTKRGLAAWQKV
ncbi:MAG: hypothetical protein AAGF35_11585 [Pseudomonadota bacterium]